MKRFLLWFFVAPALCLSLALPADAADFEKQLVKSIGERVLKKQTERDGNCTVTRYFFKQSPDMVLEFKCDRINVAWDQFNNPPQPAKNAEVAALAKRAAAALVGNNGAEVDRALAGHVFKGEDMGNGLKINGSCQTSCLLSYRAK